MKTRLRSSAIDSPDLDSHRIRKSTRASTVVGSEIRFEYAQVEMARLNGRAHAACGAVRRLFLNRVTPLLPLNPRARWWHVPVTGSRGERGHVRNKPRRETQSHLSRCASTSPFHASHRVRCVVAGDCLDMRDSAAVVISRRGDRRRRVAIAAS